ncbi:MAG: Asp-tRNA(Asn)/Glu-tRNA(Gln) amidotransferase subunit GatC [Candidatus Brocadiia bacterium]
MDIDNNLIEHLAYLSRLKLKDDEKESLKNHLKKILDHVDELKELNVTKAGPLIQADSAGNILRDDVIKPCLPTDKALQNAPDKKLNFFRVPRVIEDAPARRLDGRNEHE